MDNKLKAYSIEIFVAVVYCAIILGFRELNFFSYNSLRTQASQTLTNLGLLLLAMIFLYSVVKLVFHRWNLKGYSLIFPILSSILLSLVFSIGHIKSGMPLFGIMGYLFIQQIIFYSITYFVMKLIK